MAIYTQTNAQIYANGYRVALDEMNEHDRAIVENGMAAIEREMKTRGGRFGPESSRELMAKLGIFLIAKEKNLGRDLRSLGTIKTLLKEID